MWNKDQGNPKVHCSHQGNKAINVKINSPAYILPNNRSDNEIGFANSSTKCNKKLTGNNLRPNGFSNISLP